MADVPLAAGAPLTFGSTADAIVEILADALGLGDFLDPVWGIYRSDGSPLAQFDNVLSVEYAKDYRVSDFQQEQGAFQSYNKVETASEPRVRFSVGGDVTARQACLDALAGAVASTELFDVITPETTYLGMTLSHYDYARQEGRGVSLLIVETHLTEVRVTASSVFTAQAVQSASGSAPVNNGTVQTTPVVQPDPVT